MVRVSLVVALIAVLALPACTLNVASFQRDVRGESEATPFTRLRAELPTAASGIDGVDITVRGGELDRGAATVSVAGLLGSGADADAVASGVAIDWLTATDPVRGLRIGYAGPTPENVWVEQVAIELPRATELDLSCEDASVDVAGLDAFVRVESTSGAIRVRDAREVSLEAASGSIDVIAEHGRLLARAGSIQMVLAGAVEAHADPGSIEGSFGRGGTLTSGVGSIDVTLTTALDRDLTITTSGESVRLVVPATIAALLEVVTSPGGVHVAAGGATHDGRDFHGALGGGGPFTVRIETESGSVVVVDQVGP